MALLSWFLDLVRRQAAGSIEPEPRLATPQRMSPSGVHWLCEWEAFRDRVYIDVGGTPAIGFGHNVLPGEDWSGGISYEQGLTLLRRDLDPREAVVRELVRVPLNIPRFDCLVSFQYNTGGLARSTLLKKLNAGDYEGAGAELERWIWSNGRVVPGLIRRRFSERQLWERGVYAGP